VSIRHYRTHLASGGPLVTLRAHGGHWWGFTPEQCARADAEIAANYASLDTEAERLQAAERQERRCPSSTA
jgi:hypothetical protein